MRPRAKGRRGERPGGGRGQELSWVGGEHAVAEAFKSGAGRVRELWVEHESKNPAVGPIIKAARAAGVAVRFVSRGELDCVTGGGRHQGLAAKVLEAPGAGLQEYLDGLSQPDKKGLVLVALDQIQDPRNLGAIARSALNLGAAGLILPERRTAPLSPAAVQASAGAILKLPVYRVVNLAQALERCKKAGLWVYGADASGRKAWDCVFNLPLVLVIGSEGYGMRSLTRELCDEVASVPQAAAGVESLNASCAASVLLYEVARQKAAAPGHMGRGQAPPNRPPDSAVRP